MGIFFRGPPGNADSFPALLRQNGLVADDQPPFSGLSFPKDASWQDAKGADPVAVRRAAMKALSLLYPGQDESGNIRAYTNDFAAVTNPSAIDTSGWSRSFSLHASHPLDSPPLPGYPGYVLKMYDNPRLGETMAVTYPTIGIAHILHAIPDYLGYPQNPAIARDFLNAPPAEGGRKK